jgi:hypothetical protein
VTLRGVGHMGPVTDPAEFAKALPAWLQPAVHELAA